MKIEESCLARRRFLCGMLACGATALGAGVAAPLSHYAGNLRKEPPPDYLEIEQADYDLLPGTSKLLWYGRIPALIIKTPGPANDLKVFVAVCTHFDCTVSYKEDENCIFCVCHEGYYDLDGQVILVTSHNGPGAE